jgi:hypothetical protein
MQNENSVIAFGDHEGCAANGLFASIEVNKDRPSALKMEV